MSTPVPPGGERDAVEVEALVADRYLEALLAAGDRPAAVSTEPELAGDLGEAARVLRHALLRVHPSFRFEERLAARLLDVGRSLAVGADRPSAGVVVAFPAAAGAGVADAPAGDDLDAELAAIAAGTLDPAAADAPAALPRPLLLGGAMASAAISLVGVAVVAWRTARPGGRGPMARAARAARLRRLDTLRSLPVPGRPS